MKEKAGLLPKLLLLPILISLFISGCEDCYECDINRPEPYFNVKFINETQLKITEDSIVYFNDQLAIKRDALNALPDDASNEEFEPLEFSIDSITAAKTTLDNKRKLIASGSVEIDTLYSPQDKSISYTDSATSYQFPLSMNQDSSTYYFSLKGISEPDTLTVSYTREVVVENGSIIVQADSIIEKPHIKTSFINSVKYQYRNDQRLTNETYLYIYF